MNNSARKPKLKKLLTTFAMYVEQQEARNTENITFIKSTTEMIDKRVNCTKRIPIKRFCNYIFF